MSTQNFMLFLIFIRISEKKKRIKIYTIKYKLELLEIKKRMKLKLLQQSRVQNNQKYFRYKLIDQNTSTTINRIRNEEKDFRK